MVVEMKGIVAFDSVHGSTKKVAEAMAEQIVAEGHEAQLIAVKDWSKGPLSADFLFIGSPTRGGKMTNAAKEFIESLDVDYWRSKKVVTFTTVGPLSKDSEKRKRAIESMGDHTKSAATKMKEICQGRGIPVHAVMHFAVVGMWGPIAPEGPEMAKERMHEFLAEL